MARGLAAGCENGPFPRIFSRRPRFHAYVFVLWLVWMCWSIVYSFDTKDFIICSVTATTHAVGVVVLLALYDHYYDDLPLWMREMISEEENLDTDDFYHFVGDLWRVAGICVASAYRICIRCLKKIYVLIQSVRIPGISNDYERLPVSEED